METENLMKSYVLSTGIQYLVMVVAMYVCMYVYNMSARLSRSVIGLLGCFELVVLHLRHPFVLWKHGMYTATKPNDGNV